MPTQVETAFVNVYSIQIGAGNELLTEELLHEHQAVLCIADTESDLEIPFVATVNWGYLRLRRPDYSDSDLKKWVKLVQEQDWSDVFVFFKHEDEGMAPQMARRFLQLVA